MSPRTTRRPHCPRRTLHFLYVQTKHTLGIPRHTLTKIHQAKAHGNEPSKGAKIDAELQAEEEETINKKKAGKTDSMPGKKN